MNIKRTVLWIVITFSLFMVWNNWQLYTNPPIQADQSQAQQDQNQAHPDDDKDHSVPASAKSNDSSQQLAATDTAPTQGAESEKILVKNNVMELTFDTKGAQIIHADIIDIRDNKSEAKRFTLLDNGEQIYTVQSGLIGASKQQGQFPNHTTPFKLVSQQTELNGDGTLPVVFEAEAGGLKVTRTYTLHQNNYKVDVNDKVENISDQAQDPSVYYQITRDDTEPPGTVKFYSTFHGFAMYSEANKFQKVALSDVDKNDMNYTKQIHDGWISFIQHFFVTAWLPEPGQEHDVTIRKLKGNKNLYAISAVHNMGEIEPGSSQEANSTLWVGPEDQGLLHQVNKTLPLVVDYGWITIIAKPMFAVMTWLHSFIGNWGWTIVALTVLLKLLLFPLSAKGYKSMAKMKNLQPRMQALKEKYGDDRQALNQAMMQMYRTEKINPLGGCFPMLIQIPIFLTLYRVILASVELRGAPWIGWIHDLSVMDPYYILPVIMVGTMFLQFQLNPKPADPTQAKIMMFMPLVFGVMMFAFPAGLVLYWIVNNILSIIQQQFITRRLNQASNQEIIKHK
ncbi:membrane protein insertase YidC [Brackiella oedipodis]|uniref:membrane protein insertase YidC n=1 Tax=Brackiella oedipodis TaxID=124225 RepID=UPI00048E4D96|nr:membrane protein insertase YidC [Brackiella oedipodis]